MAIYKNREVLLLGALTGAPDSPMRIEYPGGVTEAVQRYELQYTEQEKKDFGLDNARTVNTISDNDLKQMRKDGKIQTRAKPVEVEVNKKAPVDKQVADKKPLFPVKH